MKKLLLAISLVAAPLHAQFLQQQSTADYSLRTTLTKESDVSYLWSVQFRNEQLFDPHRAYFITDVFLSGIAGQQPWNPQQYEQHLPSYVSGNVFTGAIAAPGASQNGFFYRSGWFDIGTPGGGGVRWGGSFTSTSILTGMGLVGCSIPILTLGSAADNHAGSTCSSAGYNGWQTIDTRITFGFANPDFDGSSLRASVYGFAYDIDTFNIVPEPAKWLLLLIGLTSMAIIKRKLS